MNNQAEIYGNIIANLNAIAKGGVSQAQAYANLREFVPELFPVNPTQAEIDTVLKSDEWVKFDGEARMIFAEAYFSAPREIDGEMVDVAAFGLVTWVADKKEAKVFSPEQIAVRKGAQAYVRIGYRQNVTKLIPRASDAPEATETETETLPDPTGTLALVTEALQILSEKNPTGALALLNGLDSLVKYARPYVSEGKPIVNKTVNPAL
jgi:hypothetical protein